MSAPDVVYQPDRTVDAPLDRELRELLSTCFTKPQDHVFRERRYFREPPAHRWLIRDGDSGRLVGHLAAHERIVLRAGREIAVGGLAEVCVHPSHQGRGYVRALVASAHRRLAAEGREFSLLFGESRYYASSGYVAAENLFFLKREAGGWTVERPAEGALVAAITSRPWPAQSGPLYLLGGSF